MESRRVRCTVGPLSFHPKCFAPLCDSDNHCLRCKKSTPGSDQGAVGRAFRRTFTVSEPYQEPHPFNSLELSAERKQTPPIVEKPRNRAESTKLWRRPAHLRKKGAVALLSYKLAFLLIP